MEECPNCGAWKNPDYPCSRCGCNDTEAEYVEKMRSRLNESYNSNDNEDLDY